MDEIRTVTEKYPRFPDGRIDYSKERTCFVLNCVVISGSKILLTKRSADVIAYPNTINGISGFIDRTDISIERQAHIELIEELEAPTESIIYLKVSEPFIQIDNSINREWHVYAVLVEFPELFVPQTNWENKSAEWYEIDTAKEMELMPGFQETLSTALTLRQGSSLPR